MFIRSLSIESFRLFRDKDFKLGKSITVISGHNATGKSTLLALLGHCGELPKHKPILQPSFRAELGDIIKFSSTYDKTISNIGTIYFDECREDDYLNSPLELTYRSTWQEKRTRYRLIPKKTPDRNTEKKISWPTMYLGLSRLYPVGESTKADMAGIKQLDEEDKQLFIQEYQRILNLFDAPEDVTAIALAETNKKKSIGINTSKYDYLCNSAGQDNIGQIIMAIISFRKLKKILNSEWNGGILLIDELDSTLHPVAQNKLVNFLYRQSREIGVQVVFTTHSLSLLQYLSQKISHNDPDSCNPYELIYITNANGELIVLQNPEYETMYYDMMASYSGNPNDSFYQNKVYIYSEDPEARYFITKLTERHGYRYKLINTSLGHQQLLDLLISDYNLYKRMLFILDGDVDETKLNKCTEKLGLSELKNIIKLPGTKRPEEIVWDYIKNLPPDHSFWNGSLLTGRTKRNLQEHGPHSADYSGFTKEREKFKKWFNNNILLVDEVMGFWMLDNPETMKEFESAFITAFNNVAPLCHLPKIIVPNSSY